MNLDSIQAKIEHAKEIRTYILSSQPSPVAGLYARALRDTILRAHHAWAAGRISSPAYRHLDRWIEAFSAEAGAHARRTQATLSTRKKRGQYGTRPQSCIANE